MCVCLGKAFIRTLEGNGEAGHIVRKGRTFHAERRAGIKVLGLRVCLACSR